MGQVMRRTSQCSRRRRQELWQGWAGFVDSPVLGARENEEVGEGGREGEGEERRRREGKGGEGRVRRWRGVKR